MNTQQALTTLIQAGYAAQVRGAAVTVADPVYCTRGGVRRVEFNQVTLRTDRQVVRFVDARS